jgi:hypothetical protein
VPGLKCNGLYSADPAELWPDLPPQMEALMEGRVVPELGDDTIADPSDVGTSRSVAAPPAQRDQHGHYTQDNHDSHAGSVSGSAGTDSRPGPGP